MPGGRGGRRQGTQGKSYPNRSDLNAQPVRVPPSQVYGQGAAMERAQQAIPLPQTIGLPPIVGPEEPTQNPGEHVMAGVPQGPGPGPEALARPPVDMSPQGSNADVLTQLQALLQVAPNQGLINLITSIKGGDYAPGGTYGRALGQP